MVYIRILSKLHKIYKKCRVVVEWELRGWIGSNIIVLECESPNTV
jgi:hypothetical protein